jgi:hypothetical protein
MCIHAREMPSDTLSDALSPPPLHAQASTLMRSALEQCAAEFRGLEFISCVAPGAAGGGPTAEMGWDLAFVTSLPEVRAGLHHTPPCQACITPTTTSPVFFYSLHHPSDGGSAPSSSSLSWASGSLHMGTVAHDRPLTVRARVPLLCLLNCARSCASKTVSTSHITASLVRVVRLEAAA